MACGFGSVEEGRELDEGDAVEFAELEEAEVGGEEVCQEALGTRHWALVGRSRS